MVSETTLKWPERSFDREFFPNAWRDIGGNFFPLERLNMIPMNRLNKWFLLAAFFAGAASETHAQTFVRTPFLQKGSYNKSEVCWRISAAASLTVKYGTDSTNLTYATTPSYDSTDGCAAMDSTKLQPATKYYYQVYNGSTLLPGEPGQYFITAPLVGARNQYKFWIIGDAGQGSIDQYQVKNGFLKVNQGTHVDGFLMLGDNAYTSGTDAQFTTNLFDVYPEIMANTFSWPCIGNHEVSSVATGAPYLNSFDMPTAGQSGGVASGQKLYYSFDYGNIHFIILDSQISSRAVGGPQWDWLQQDLEATRQDWIVAYWHHPPYSFSGHNSDNEQQLIDMRQNFCPLLEQYGVDMLFAGHSHDYERSFLIDSAYGNSTSNIANAATEIKDNSSGNPATTGPYRKASIKGANQGAVYMVAGTGGGALDAGTLHPVMYTQHTMFGFVLMTVKDTVATTQFYDSTGALVDQYQIVKTRGVSTALGRPGLKQNQMNFLQMGRHFQFSTNNSAPFRVYSLAGNLMSREIPRGSWDADPKTLPSGVYYFRYGAQFGKISLP